MAKKRHPNKEIADAVAYAEARGWVIVRGGAHAWGILRCPHGQRAGYSVSVWSTPRDPYRHAHRIRQAVDRCPH